MWSLHVLPVSVWVYPGYSGFCQKTLSELKIVNCYLRITLLCSFQCYELWRNLGEEIKP